MNLVIRRKLCVFYIAWRTTEIAILYTKFYFSYFDLTVDIEIPNPKLENMFH